MLVSLVWSSVAVSTEAGRSDTSRLTELGAYYSQLQAKLQAKGLLRTDRNPINVAVTPASLARDFRHIALAREYGKFGHTPLMRWENDVRLSVVFGPSVPKSQRAEDMRQIWDYAAHLSRVTGHSIKPNRSNSNFLVVVADEKELKGMGNYIRQQIPDISDRAIRKIVRMPRNHLCMVLTKSHAEKSRGIRTAVAIIRAEHSGIMRRSCIEEEIAQGLGLFNDWREARPSIFNDDEEFAVLTRHDELLLKMLYHPDLKSGMQPDGASEIVRRLAADLL